MNEEIGKLKDEEKEMPSEEKEKSIGLNRNWLPGLILIGLGIIFLLANTTGLHLNNWWALFIAIPAVKQLSQAWSGWQRNGRLNSSARGALISGLILTLVTITFLFSLNWSYIWPLFLVIAGLGALLSGWLE